MCVCVCVCVCVCMYIYIYIYIIKSFEEVIQQSTVVLELCFKRNFSCVRICMCVHTCIYTYSTNSTILNIKVFP